jgi:uncharacterized protein YqeY
MSNLLQKINEDIKQSMFSKDAERLSVLRMLSAALRNKEISLRQGEGKIELSDEQVVETLQSEIKKRRDSAEAYLNGNRPELADKEKQEIEYLNGYLPAQLSEDEIEKIIKDIIAEIGGTPNFGQVMGKVMAATKGKADGKVVGELVKKILS